MKSRRSLWTAAGFLSLWALIACAFPFPMYGQTTRPIGPFVWYQPMGSFQKWHDRGIKTLLGFEGEGLTTPAQVDKYCAAAAASGFTYVLQASASAHWSDAKCCGVIMGDEPNAGIGMRTQAQVDAEVAGIRAKTDKPIYVDLNAGAVLKQSDAVVAGYCKGADVICFFSYPINYGMGMAGAAEIVQTIDKLHRVAPGKPIVQITECSDQRISDQDWTAGNDATGTPLRPKMRGPTGKEMSSQIKIGLAMGADGFGYFPDVIGKFNWLAFDGTTPDCESEMKAINAAFTSPAGAAPSAAIQFDLTINGVKYAPVKP